MTGQKTSSVRSGHELDNQALETYLADRIPGFTKPLQVSQFAFGQSNPTYLLKDGNQQQYVLRKKPPGALISKTAHAVEREYRIIHALGQHTDVPVPKVYALCEDGSVIGTPFYVMEFLKGRIFEDIRMPELSFEDRKECFYSALETLAKLHRVDFKAIGLENYGRNSGFYDRQMKSLHKVSLAQAAVVDKETGEKVVDIPRLDEMFAWFSKNQPKDVATIVHGDFKMDNLVFHPTKNQVIGILDWELSTIGHPYSDLANFLQPYSIPSVAGGFMGAKGPLPVPTAEELMQVYCKHSGLAYPIPQWQFAVAFAHFRLAVITQGIAARVARKQASSAFARETASRCVPMSNLTLQIVDQGDLVDAKSKL
ncbi:kinase-like protein [Hesseltinella vesiculosa]|uniref:Kinase-like protein n=1 Tax=Hesseltinella vesiculosa TaxID=101127 RepID=A0A1X2G9B6_9FUNG|nr:kinase-like protein [Hesseltinella vesiculosa]